MSFSSYMKLEKWYAPDALVDLSFSSVDGVPGVVWPISEDFFPGTEATCCGYLFADTDGTGTMSFKLRHNTTYEDPAGGVNATGTLIASSSMSRGAAQSSSSFTLTKPATAGFLKLTLGGGAPNPGTLYHLTLIFR